MKIKKNRNCLTLVGRLKKRKIWTAMTARVRMSKADFFLDMSKISLIMSFVTGTLKTVRWQPSEEIQDQVVGYLLGSIDNTTKEVQQRWTGGEENGQLLP